MSEAVVVDSVTRKQVSIAGLKDRLGHLIESGNARLTELDHLLDRVAKDDWSFSGMRRRVDALRDRAATARASTVKRLDEMPGKAVSAVAAAGRAKIQDLARGLKRLGERLEQNETVPEEAKREPARIRKDASPVA